jgi:hypothetical protein
MGVALRQGLGNQDGVNVLQQAGVKVFLRLCFTDPEGTKRFFPPELPVRVEFGGGGTARSANCTLGDNGRLTFLARGTDAQAWREFTLQFPAQAASPRYCVYEAPGASPSPPGSPPAVPRVANALPNTQERFFRMPVNFAAGGSWGLRHSDWTAGTGANAFPGHATFTANTGIVRHNQDPPLDIGTVDEPVELILNPHWKYFRFEFFDRYYGPASRGSPARPSHGARITLPAITLGGYRDHPNAADAEPIDTECDWTIDGGANKRLQCLPFILRRDQNAADLPPLTGANLGLRFNTVNGYVFSQSDTVREIRTVAPNDAVLNPGPDRLRYYDLPPVWKSRRYYTRNLGGSPPADGKFFQNLTQADVDRGDDRGTPLVFCLDDLVLYDNSTGALRPLPPQAPAAPERVVIFHHRFDNSLAGATNHGIFKPLALADAADPLDLPRTNVTPDNNYILEYPDWTRLIAARGCLFDVFDQRCPDSADATRVVGARAAVRWVDTTAPFPGVTSSALVGNAFVAQADGLPIPGRMLSAAAARTDHPAANPLFSIQPYYRQQTARRYQVPYNVAQGEQVGRFDIVLLRCCDVEGGQEIAVNFHYLRSFFVFNFVPPAPAVPSNLPVPDQCRFANNISLNVANRWNGDDRGISQSRVELLPQSQSPPTPLKIYVVWFPQSTPRNWAHFAVNILSGGGRDNRGSQRGNGESGEQSFQTQADFWFPAAHETGHMSGLPDEYNERWNGASYQQLSFKTNLPGDPYEPDGRTELGGQLDSGMMNSNRRPRNRYFWHNAEWIRQITNVALKVKYTDISGTVYDDYWLPAHPQTAAGRTYYPWPLVGMLNQPAANPVCDLFLFRLGKDRYSQHILSTITAAPMFAAAGSPPAPPAARTFDGILIVGIRLRCRIGAWANLQDEQDNRERILAEIAGMVRLGMNYRFFASGDLAAPAVHFDRCLIQFTPQFLVTNFPNYGPAQAPPQPVRTVAGDPNYIDINPALANGVLGVFGANAQLEVWAQAPVGANWNAANSRLTMNIQNWADVATQMEANFPRFLGLARTMQTVTAADIQPLLQTVFPGANVQNL